MYFKILEIFILKTLFNTGEYNITSKNFNPIKFIIILFLVSNVFFTIFLLIRLNDIHEHLEKTCPAVLSDSVKKVQSKEELIKVMDDHIKSERESKKKLEIMVKNEPDLQQKQEYIEVLKKLDEHINEELEERKKLAG